MTAPVYRADIKGKVALFIADFKDSMKGEIENPENDTWLLSAEDSYFYSEYQQYLTPDEMKRAFTQATKEFGK